MAPEFRVGEAPRRSVVERRRLLDRLARRFDVRLTLLTGGAGSGKTTLLAQAMSAEHHHLDVWVPCRSADREADELVRSIVAAIDGPGDRPDRRDDAAQARLAELILACAPRQVCVVLDDAHLLGDGAAITEVLDLLPANGHVLVASRTRPPIPLARLHAAGDVEEVTQAELMLTEDELVQFANLRGVDVDAIVGVDGWPAFVELAATGTVSASRQYLDEEALRPIDPDRRNALARFAFVGGGDDDVALAVSGCSLDQLVADVPLVRWSGGVAQLHDLWADLLIGGLSEADRRDAAVAAATLFRKHGDLDRAVELAVTVGDDDGLAETLRVALRDGVGGGLRIDRLRRWRAALPDDFEPSVVSLLDGLIEREIDPTSPAAFASFARAAEGLSDLGDDELLLVALTQLGYLARILHDTEAVASVATQLDRLADHYPPALPFRAIGEAWVALTTGDTQRRLDVLSSVPPDALPPTWEVTRRHLIAHALFQLGRADEGLAVVPEDIDRQPVSIPGALATHSQCTWYAGFPDRALASPPHGSSHLHGARDRFIAAAWEAMMHACAGDPVRARARVHEAAGFVGDRAGPLVQAQVVGIEILAFVADGNEASAAALLRKVLADAPLGGGISEFLLREHFALCYLLAPETHSFWDEWPMPPRWGPIRELCRALYHVRETDDTASLARATWPEPGLIAAHIPCPWAMELAVAGEHAGRPEARRLSEWLCEHWQAPARDALLRLADGRHGTAAQRLLAEVPIPPTTAASLRVLGQSELRLDEVDTNDPDWRRERVRALVVWCLLHPQTTREQAASALWPDASSERATKNLRTTLNYALGVLEPGRRARDAPWYLRSSGSRLSLHPSLSSDLEAFRRELDAADAAESSGHPSIALPHLEQAVGLWRGDLAEDLDHPWLELERIHLRSRYVRAACRISELSLVTGQPERAVDAARLAIDADPYHEPSYDALAQVYRALDDHSSARAVLQRLEQLLHADADH